MVCLWKFHNLYKSAIGTYMRVTVNMGIDTINVLLPEARI